MKYEILVCLHCVTSLAWLLISSYLHTPVTNAIKIHHLCLKFSNKSYGNNENFIKLRAKFFTKLMEGYCKVRTALLKSENENTLLVCMLEIYAEQLLQD